MDEYGTSVKMKIRIRSKKSSPSKICRLSYVGGFESQFLLLYVKEFVFLCHQRFIFAHLCRIHVCGILIFPEQVSHCLSCQLCCAGSFWIELRCLSFIKVFSYLFRILLSYFKI